MAQDVLVATHMRLQQFERIRRFTCATLIGMALFRSGVHAQAIETITAVAEVTLASGAISSTPFTIVINRFATDGERVVLVHTVKKGGTKAARRLLASNENAGRLRFGAHTTAVKYAFAHSISGGRLITVVTTEPIVVSEGDQTRTKPTGHRLGFVLIKVAEAGMGYGEVVPMATIRVDERDAIVTEAFNAAHVVRLSNVVRK